jgi:hypothetical protein
MGNQTSQTNNFQKEFYQLQNEMKNQRKQFIDFQKVQQEIYNAQMKMQTMRNQQNQQQNQNRFNQNQQQYQNQNQQQPMNNKMASLLSSPELKEQVKSNPLYAVEVIKLILNEFSTDLTQEQYTKINNYLENVSQQASQQQSQQQLTNQANQQLKQQHQQQNNQQNYQQQNNRQNQQQLTNQSHQQYQQNNRQNQQNQQNQLQLHPKNNMDLSQRYLSEEEQEREKFEREQQKQRKLFEEQQRRRKEEYQRQLKSFEDSQINPYKLLELPQNYTLEQLKLSYRKKALKNHPDKGGNPQIFDEITKAYFSLLEKLKKKEDDKQFIDLKNQSKDYIGKQLEDNKQNIKLKAEKFNLTSFNKIFEENKIDDPTDTGYEDWLKNDNNAKEPPKVFSQKFNINNFNSMFEDWKDQDEHLEKEIVLRDEPNALMAYHGKTGFTELGVDRIDDFTNADPNSRNLGYTDLKQAYSKSGIINTRAVSQRESYKNVDEYEKARAKVSYTMTPEEMRREAIKKKREEEQEEIRVQRIQNRDNQAFKSYNRVHQMMLDKL